MRNFRVILLLASLSLLVFDSYAEASWKAPLAPPPAGIFFPAVNVSNVTERQDKAGGLTVNKLEVKRSASFGRIGVGADPNKANGINVGGDIRAGQFCLGVVPSPEGCISNWPEGFGLSGGRPNSLVRWLSSGIGSSAISEVGNDITIGSVASSKNVSALGSVTVDSGTKLQSGLKLSQMAGVSTTGLPSRNVILSVDQTTGEIVLKNAECGVATAPPPVASTCTNDMWCPRRFFRSFPAFNNKLWITGGEPDTTKSPLVWRPQEENRGWSSPDGATWTKDVDNMFLRKLDPTVVIFNGKLWNLGGRDKAGGLATLYNDVWSSSDGVSWVQETSNAGWSKRVDHAATVFNGKIWILGGYNGASYLNDVWSSPDGRNWTRETARAGWYARGQHASFVFNNKIWVIGGGDFNHLTTNDVWSSSDGINWTQETARAGWSERSGYSVSLFNGKIWVMGGMSYPSRNYNDDVWSSSDGINWTQEVIHAGWPPRSQFSIAIFNNKLWVMGGAGGSWPSSLAYLNDVWSSSDGINWTRER